jgi:hypothetical protein
MKYWTICYPLDDDRVAYETLAEPEILAQYFDYWSGRMKSVGRHSQISAANCIEDWCIIHWAWETNVYGDEVNIVKGYN